MRTAMSGGYKAKATATGKGPARKRGESAAEKEAVPVSEESRIALVDPDSGDPYWESSKTGETQWEDPNSAH